MNPLLQFATDVHTKDAVFAFLVSYLDKEALERVYAGEETKHIKDARKVLERAFEDLTIQHDTTQQRSSADSSR